MQNHICSIRSGPITQRCSSHYTVAAIQAIALLSIITKRCCARAVPKQTAAYMPQCMESDVHGN